MSVCLSGSPSVDQLSDVSRAELEQFIILPAKTEVNQIEIKEQRENERGNCEGKRGRGRYIGRGMETGEGVGERGLAKSSSAQSNNHKSQQQFNRHNFAAIPK